jgi:type II secretory pathway pseudopilin PulG
MLKKLFGTPRQESGSMVIAIGVVLVLGMLSTATLSRTLVQTRNVRHTQDFSGALATADSGLSDALYQIDQAPTATFNGSGASGGGSFSYTATYVDQNTWTVRSQGTLNGIKHAIQATVSRDEEYPYAIFTEQDLTLDGNSTGNISSYNSITGATNTGNADIGSNHAITVRGGGGGDAQDYYTPAGSCTGCTNGHQRQAPRVVADPTAPTTYQACPSGGNFSGIVNGGNGLTYLCNTNVTFSGTVTVVSGPLVIYVGPGYNVSVSDASINVGGQCRNFQLLKAGSGSFNIGNGAHAGTACGVVYAPSSDITVNGGQMFLNGSLTANSLTINGSPNFTMSYDDSIATITTTSWKVTNWHEVPSS